MRPFTINDFFKRLQREHQADEEKKRRKQKEAKRLQEKQKLEKAIMLDSHERVEKDLESWVKDQGDVTYKWAVAARAGNAKTQLNDYASKLEQSLLERQNDIKKMQDDIELMQIMNASGSATPKTPKTPSAAAFFSPKFSDSIGSPSFDRQGKVEESKIVKAERLMQAAFVGNVDEVERCLNGGININAVTWRGTTALMVAARHGRGTVIDTLLDRHADLARTDMNGHTAVDHARKQPAVRAQLKMAGGLSSQEMANKVESLAELVLQAKAKQMKLQAQQALLKNAKTRQPVLLRSISVPVGAESMELRPLSRMETDTHPLDGPRKHVTLSLPLNRYY